MARFDLLAKTDLESFDGTSDKGGRITNGFIEGNEIWQRPGLGSAAAYAIGTSTASGFYFGTGGAGMTLLWGSQTDAYPPAPLLYLAAAYQTAGAGPGGGPGGSVFRVNPPRPTSTRALSTLWYRWNPGFSQTGGVPINLGVSDTSFAAGVVNYAPIQWGTAADHSDSRLLVSTYGGRYAIFGSGALPTAKVAALGSLTVPYFVMTTSADTKKVGDPFKQANEQFSFAVYASGQSLMMKSASNGYITTGTATSLTAIGSNYPALTVPGVTYLDGTFYVMTPTGVIWNSTPAADDPTTWPADGFISAEFESDGAVALGKVLNYIVAFGRWTIQMFWNAGNPTGSPLLPVQNGVILIGCAAAGSIAYIESTTVFMGVRKSGSASANANRFIAILVGTSYETISTPDVERILNADDLAAVYACIVELQGHTWYVLTLETSGLTLVLDLKTKKWYFWTKLTASSGVTLSSLTQAAGLATGTATNHGFSDGDRVVISGATPAGYNGTFQVNVTSSSTFTYRVSSALTTPATGTIIATGWTEAYMPLVASASVGKQQLVQDLAGNVHEISLTSYVDTSSAPINFKIRSREEMNGNNQNKFCAAVTPLGDVLTSTGYGMIRYTDDEYQSYSYYRLMDLSDVRPQVNRMGAYRRRAWEFRYMEAQQYRIKDLEVDLTKGVT